MWTAWNGSAPSEPFGRAVYRFSEYLSTLLPDRVVTDARSCRTTITRGSASEHLHPYGTPVGRTSSAEILAQYGVERGRYFLYVTGWSPKQRAGGRPRIREGPHRAQAGRGRRCALQLRLHPQSEGTKDQPHRVHGYVFGSGYREFQSNAYGYIQATEVGARTGAARGHGHGNCILANDVPEHREALGDAGVYYRIREPGSLASGSPGRSASGRGPAAARKGHAARRGRYSWEKVTLDYERLFLRMTGIR